MSLEIGIVGLPNVGKSTLFNALLKKQQAFVANYPFATIEPNVGIVPVPDERLSVLSKLEHDAPIVPATVQFVDIAGLVKGASKGEGLGNQFLANIRETNLICHVLRGFDDGDIIKTGSDPVGDYDTINTELLLADLSTLEKIKAPKGSSSKEDAFKWEVVSRIKPLMEQGKRAYDLLSTPEEKELCRQLGLLTAKQELLCINVNEGDVSSSAVEEHFHELFPNHHLILISAKIESEIAVLSETDQQEFMSALGLKESGLTRLIKAAYQWLGLQSFLTSGEKEVRAWTIHVGDTAVLAAGVIHTDFMKKFIKANIVSYDQFVSHGGWKGARESGVMRIEGRDYVMQNNDVVEFMIGA